MSTIVTNPTPKQRFQQLGDKIISSHRDMIASAQFERAADHALLELTRAVVVGADGNPNMALAGFYRIQGALEFLNVIRNLAESSVSVVRERSDALNHDA